ncbi:MAG: hypothetical protein KJ955_07280 [Nanoarchaeota archaeon]|nr:hypothetical protein [Nanoarchaeota archaeon]
MRKILIAVLCAFLLLASIAAAQAALPTMQAKASDLNIAKNVAPAVQANAFGVKADKSQCMCSADTLAKIEQIKKLLSELEQSCMIIENPGRTPPSQPTFSSGNCVEKCLTDQNAVAYCKESCIKNGVLDNVCFDACYAPLKVKCENSCNVGEQKPAEQPGCLDNCYQTTKKLCIDAGCTNPNSDYNEGCRKYDCGNYMENCQKQCGVQPAVTTEAPDALGQCSASCELKYSDCKNSCHASSGVDAPKYDSCVEQQCMPILKQCSASCNSQYGKQETFVQKVANVFRTAQYRNAKWICHDGTESVEGGDTSCKPSETWSSYAKQACEGKCSTETNKCGVNTFMVYNEC